MYECRATGETAETYRAYLTTEWWKAVRTLMREDAPAQCPRCGRRYVQAWHVHHRNYKNVGNESRDDLLILCADCHEAVHAIEGITKAEGVASDDEYSRDDYWERIREAAERDEWARGDE